MKRFLQTLLLIIIPLAYANAQSFSPQGPDRMASNGRTSKGKDGARDTTGQKQIPRGLTVWTIDEITGTKHAAEPDTTSYLRMNHVYASGVYGEYQTLGNNGSPRLNRIYTDRVSSFDFPFVNGYSQVLIAPSDFHFTNTLSPITNLSYDECGNKINGEDHLKALFAVNANKQLGFGLKFDYLYARGYYSNQNLSHFNTTFWGSYEGDRYQAHLLLSTNHQKQTENGGISNDDYIKHPELFNQSFSENEIPTVLDHNWNINDNHHIFFNQRYSVGFNRRVPMTAQERQAKEFAMQAEKEKTEREKQLGGNIPSSRKQLEQPVAEGRPADAKVQDVEPEKKDEDTSDRVQVTVEEANEMAAEDDKKSEEDQFMKNEYVPVTSFFHTAKIDIFRRVYRAYQSPENYYANDYYSLTGDSINDRIRHTYVRNNLGIAMLEGFNKWAKAGINLYAAHELRHYDFEKPDGSFEPYNENSLIVGGGLIKHEGHTFHFDAQGEYYVLGDDYGQLNLSGNFDLNFPLLGDTVTLNANAAFTVMNPDTYFCKYTSRHFQWENDFDKETKMHIEGNLSLKRTETRLRFAADNITNYTYFGTSYSIDDSDNHIGTTITPRQSEKSIQVITAQLYQNLHFGILHWDNILTFQQTTNADALPLPKLNIYSNLYLRFRIAKVLDTDFGADVRYFTKYNAPEYCPALQSFAIQENEAIRTSVGNYPIVNAYFNFNLKNCRFFLMMSHVNCSGKGNYFLTPHNPINGRVLRFGLSWNFFN